MKITNFKVEDTLGASHIPMIQSGSGGPTHLLLLHEKKSKTDGYQNPDRYADGL